MAHPERYCNTEPVLQQSCFSWPLANAVKNGTQFYDTAIKTPTKGYVNDHSVFGKEDKEVCSDVD